MKIKIPIAKLEQAISEAEHKDPAYEPGRSTSTVTELELEIEVPLAAVELKSMNCRRLNANADVHIREMPTSPLILIRANGECGFAAKSEDKDALYAKFDPKADLLLWAWAGKWRTDVFVLTQSDLTWHYK